MNIAFGLLIIELIVWYLTHETATKSPVSMRTRLRTTLTHFRSQKESGVSLGERLASSVRAWASRLSSRDAIRRFVLRPCEAVNSAWLVYIISAQTFGSYQNCSCMATTWARGGVSLLHSNGQWFPHTVLTGDRDTLISRRKWTGYCFYGLKPY